MKQAVAQRPLARVSLKDSVVIFRKIRNKPLSRVKRFLKDLLEKKIDIDGKYYTKACEEILDLIEEAESNAENLGLDKERLFLKEAVANKAFTFILPKSRWSHRGRKAKICQLKVTLEER